MRTQFLFVCLFLCEEAYHSQHRDYVTAGEQGSIAGRTAVFFFSPLRPCGLQNRMQLALEVRQPHRVAIFQDKTNFYSGLSQFRFCLSRHLPGESEENHETNI